MTLFEILQAETATEREALLAVPIIGRALAGDIDREEYVAFLVQAFHHVKHTVPLLMATGARLPDSKEWLREAVAEYIEEELGHQEWILNDLQACGYNREQVRHSRPALATELMVSYAWDTVTRVNPVGFFGMVHVLEGTSVNIASLAADQIRTSLGLPKKAFSYLYSHGALDQDHVLFFETLVNRLKDPADQQAVIHAARVFYHLYADVFRSIDRVQVRVLAA
jgi:pyrroloquinoline quinone (PQQ) biosynthesis protein C